jgi:hypothetical protein
VLFTGEFYRTYGGSEFRIIFREEFRAEIYPFYVFRKYPGVLAVVKITAKKISLIVTVI